MRTNIDIDDILLAKAMKATGLKTKKAAVEEGLRLIVQLKAQEKALHLGGKIPWDGDLNESRLGHNAG